MAASPPHYDYLYANMYVDSTWIVGNITRNGAQPLGAY